MSQANMYRLAGGIFGALVVIILGIMYQIPWWVFILFWLVFVALLYLVFVAPFYLTGIQKMVRWSNDPNQQELVQLLIAAGRSGDSVYFLTSCARRVGVGLNGV
jgi:hypothetical protein